MPSPPARLVPFRTRHLLSSFRKFTDMPQIEQANLNLTFTEGDVVMFEVTGDK